MLVIIPKLNKKKVRRLSPRLMRDLVGAHSFCCGLDVACHLIDVADVFEADGLGLEFGELGWGDRVGCLLEHAHGLKVVLGNVEAQGIAAARGNL